MPKRGDNDVGVYKLGLVRKGVSKSGDSLLNTLSVMLNKKNAETLITHLMKDLRAHENIFKIGDGTFVNHFYSDLEDIDDKSANKFILFLLEQEGIKHKRRHEKLLTKGGSGRKNLFRGSSHVTSLNNHYYRVYSALQNYESYLKDNTEKDDKYLTSVLCSIMKMENNMTFGGVVDDIGIVVFEEINGEIKINEPMGSFIADFKKLYLIHKYRNNYEPIYLNLFEEYSPLLDPENIKDVYEESVKKKRINNKFKTIKDFVQNIVESISNILRVGKKKEYKQLPPATELVDILIRKKLPIVSVVYDDYGLIRYIETIDNCLVPVKPTGLETFGKYCKSHTEALNVKDKYLSFVSSKPKIDRVYEILRMLNDEVKTELYLNYLDNVSVNVIEFYDSAEIKGKSVKKHTLYMRELVINETSFIPIDREVYNKGKHPEILFRGEIRDIDSCVSTGVESFDTVKTFILSSAYKRDLNNHISRKLYINYLKSKNLSIEIDKIKASKIMRTYHKIRSIHEILKKSLDHVCNFVNEEHDELSDMFHGEKINIYHIDETPNTVIFYKILMGIATLFVNYSRADYNRLISTHVNEEMLSRSISDNEIYFNYNDIELDEYKYLFANLSISLRNVNLYNETLTSQQFDRIKKMRAPKDVYVDFEKKNPKIITDYLHKSSMILKYTEKESKYVISQMGLPEESKITGEELRLRLVELINTNELREWVLDEPPIDIVGLFKRYLGNKIKDTDDIIEIVKDNKLQAPELYLISYIMKVGYNLFLYNKDNIIDLIIVMSPQSLNEHVGETNMISLIQTNKYCGSISIRNELMFPLDSYNRKYRDVLKKQYRRLYDAIE